ncbi:transport protein particle complex subunit [Microstroma glucosiphilum]|uniref:Trafficking protein particle complex subunit n=1 Tax=Pseudomicrostroma glucosiphilum TaxID=1684307 RepID=A0A316UE95_9BASI|nr:transport protein particle complex subunit [Pseudomicrostroma glucosiphilum]PWN22701.1 transport protein particle complex subunit [Pseudomicrostroma glucosiphilum]
MTSVTSSSQLWIISKAGGLIYQSAPPSGASPAFNSVSSNEALILAGTLHGIHAITARLDPTTQGRNKGAMESLEADGFGLAIKGTATGVKFVLLHPATHPNPQGALQKCYEVYADQVMKNPFYTIEMPIRVQGFDREVAAVLVG